MGLFDDYASAVCAVTGRKPGHYMREQLNDKIENMMPGEMLISAKMFGVEDVPIVGRDITLYKYVRHSLIDDLPNELTFMPVYIPTFLVSSLDNWHEWVMFGSWAKGHGLTPFVLFRNAPMDVRGVEVYVGDIRFWLDHDFLYA